MARDRPDHLTSFLLRRPHIVVAAFLRLVQARMIWSRLPAAEILARLGRPSRGATRITAARREEMARALAGLSRRTPWRSDCLVQALAARLWLDALGAPSELRIGASRDGEGVTAHAWLLSGGEVVTGGRLDPRIAPFEPPAPPPDQALPR